LTSKEDIKLAIIVPYYKNNFISEALNSIQQQTNQNFNLYIGDDASPYSITEFIDRVKDDFKERVSYHRFDENLGSKSLTKQWERCIALSADENYIWLFSDDDVMPFDAVQRFYDFINQSNKPSADLFRFNVSIIDNESKLIGSGKLHPPFETAENFAKRRMHGQCLSTACEFIFTRYIYESKNKFVEFPLAWCSDDATWIKFSEEKGIYTISGEPVLWRMSGLNISSDSEKSYKLKFTSAIRYVKFIDTLFVFSNEEKFEWLIGQLFLVGNSL
jgi:glycosyltransferase involved in cell wall biosynthesis